MIKIIINNILLASNIITERIIKILSKQYWRSQNKRAKRIINFWGHECALFSFAKYQGGEDQEQYAEALIYMVFTPWDKTYVNFFFDILSFTNQRSRLEVSEAIDKSINNPLVCWLSEAFLVVQRHADKRILNNTDQFPLH